MSPRLQGVCGAFSNIIFWGKAYTEVASIVGIAGDVDVIGIAVTIEVDIVDRSVGVVRHVLIALDNRVGEALGQVAGTNHEGGVAVSVEHVLEGDSAVSSGLDAVEVSAEELSSILLHRGGNEAARQRDRTGSVRTGVSVGQGVTVDGGNDLGLGGAVDVADGRLSITVAQSGVLPLDVLNDTIGVLSGDVNSADQVVIAVEVPDVLGGLGTGLIKLEPLGIVIVGAFDGVLEVVVPDEGLCALDAVSLADDLSVVSDILAAIGSNRSGGALTVLTVTTPVVLLTVLLV